MNLLALKPVCALQFIRDLYAVYAAFSKLASSRTMNASFPPSSKVPFFKYFPHIFATALPPVVPPVNFTAAMFGCAMMLLICWWVIKTLVNSDQSKPLNLLTDGLRFSKCVFKGFTALRRGLRVRHNDWVADHHAAERAFELHPKWEVERQNN